MKRIETHGLTASYGDFQALFGIDLVLEPGETTAIIGANGAGKSTFMKALTGLMQTEAGMITVDGQPAGARAAHQIIDTGIAMAPEGRRLFGSLSVEENLLIGQRQSRSGPWTLDRIYKTFPILEERRKLPAMSLSGGQQQMVSIGRALMSNPDVLLCDEISLGLAPVIIEDLYKTIVTLGQEGMSIVIVEQDIARALSVAHQVYCFQEGRVSLGGSVDTISREQITQAYFGID
ncbi:ABC-transporter ATP-binding protein [Octadecabacter antarcticus 307]|uniref:ABC-transporter ATP-binding protein n=1 Tax=Octadecabacter antarcticus 307 TaxID=391626 RepID=M9RE18_9RHOB|nr:ATP-binding cassette domain-containing protein [Octadecabacter antarcticus]AGI68661.1 ABC-transporter ATP-binding protein [Octadecabacter antarcticus 307]